LKNKKEGKLKTLITVSVDAELITEARSRNVKLSELMNNSLKTFLEMESDMSDDMSLDDKIVTAKARVMSLESEKERKNKEKLKERGERIILR